MRILYLLAHLTLCQKLTWMNITQNQNDTHIHLPKTHSQSKILPECWCLGTSEKNHPVRHYFNTTIYLWSQLQNCQSTMPGKFELVWWLIDKLTMLWVSILIDFHHFVSRNLNFLCLEDMFICYQLIIDLVIDSMKSIHKYWFWYGAIFYAN